MGEWLRDLLFHRAAFHVSWARLTEVIEKSTSEDSEAKGWLCDLAVTAKEHATKFVDAERARVAIGQRCCRRTCRSSETGLAHVSAQMPWWRWNRR